MQHPGDWSKNRKRKKKGGQSPIPPWDPLTGLPPDPCTPHTVPQQTSPAFYPPEDSRATSPSPQQTGASGTDVLIGLSGYSPFPPGLPYTLPPLSLSAHTQHRQESPTSPEPRQRLKRDRSGRFTRARLKHQDDPPWLPGCDAQLRGERHLRSKLCKVQGLSDEPAGTGPPAPALQQAPHVISTVKEALAGHQLQTRPDKLQTPPTQQHQQPPDRSDTQPPPPSPARKARSLSASIAAQRQRLAGITGAAVAGPGSIGDRMDGAGAATQCARLRLDAAGGRKDDREPDPNAPPVSPHRQLLLNILRMHRGTDHDHVTAHQAHQETRLPGSGSASKHPRQQQQEQHQHKKHQQDNDTSQDLLSPQHGLDPGPAGAAAGKPPVLPPVPHPVPHAVPPAVLPPLGLTGSHLLGPALLQAAGAAQLLSSFIARGVLSDLAQEQQQQPPKKTGPLPAASVLFSTPTLLQPQHVINRPGQSAPQSSAGEAASPVRGRANPISPGASALHPSTTLQIPAGFEAGAGAGMGLETVTGAAAVPGSPKAIGSPRAAAVPGSPKAIGSPRAAILPGSPRAFAGPGSPSARRFGSQTLQAAVAAAPAEATAAIATALETACATAASVIARSPRSLRIACTGAGTGLGKQPLLVEDPIRPVAADVRGEGASAGSPKALAAAATGVGAGPELDNEQGEDAVKLHVGRSGASPRAGKVTSARAQAELGSQPPTDTLLAPAVQLRSAGCTQQGGSILAGTAGHRTGDGCSQPAQQGKSAEAAEDPEVVEGAEWKVEGIVQGQVEVVVGLGAVVAQSTSACLVKQAAGGAGDTGDADRGADCGGRPEAPLQSEGGGAGVAGSSSTPTLPPEGAPAEGTPQSSPPLRLCHRSTSAAGATVVPALQAVHQQHTGGRNVPATPPPSPASSAGPIADDEAAGQLVNTHATLTASTQVTSECGHFTVPQFRDMAHAVRSSAVAPVSMQLGWVTPKQMSEAAFDWIAPPQLSDLAAAAAALQLYSNDPSLAALLASADVSEQASPEAAQACDSQAQETSRPSAQAMGATQHHQQPVGVSAQQTAGLRQQPGQKVGHTTPDAKQGQQPRVPAQAIPMVGPLTGGPAAPRRVTVYKTRAQVVTWSEVEVRDIKA